MIRICSKNLPKRSL
uniref:Uncharacterized protein n=1 Tax=Anguilla anguilla TaxID=7936 RepID=A0A0E9USF2_ANGAN